jgi:spore maturation protein CgeB
VHRGWEKALKKAGHTVMTFNSNDRLTFYGFARMPVHEKPACTVCNEVPTRQAVEGADAISAMALDGLYRELFLFWPDVVFFVSGFYLTPAMLQVIRTRRIKIVMLHTESPYQDAEQMQRGQFADLNLVNDPVNLEEWRDLDVPAAYMPHAYDPDIHFPAPYRSPFRTYDMDFVFIGTLFKSRAEFFSKMDFTGLNVAFGGSGWDRMLESDPELVTPILKYLAHPVDHCVDNEETARQYRAARCGINFYRRESEDAHKGEGWAMGPREVEMAACGLFFLRDPRPESDEVFGDGKRAVNQHAVLPSFSSPEEATELLHWWVQHPDMREHRAQQAYERIAARTFDNNARAALGLMEEAGIL